METFKELLLNCLDEEIKNKRPPLAIIKVLLHKDNARLCILEENYKN